MRQRSRWKSCKYSCLLSCHSLNWASSTDFLRRVFLLMSTCYRLITIAFQHTEEKHVLKSLILQRGKRVERMLFFVNSSNVSLTLPTAMSKQIKRKKNTDVLIFPLALILMSKASSLKYLIK